MAVKKKIIAVPAISLKTIAAKHHITESAVYNMLSYKSNSQLAQLVRKQALELYGGVSTTKVYF